MNKSNKLLSDIVTFRTYAKYLPNFNRRETFEETINRKLIMDLDKFGGYSKSLSRDIIKAYQQVHDYKIMPSMRGLQFSGEAVLRNNLRQYNCFSGYTEFVTDEGIKRFVDFEDGDEVNILSRRGFKKATIKKFGEEHLLELVVGKGRRKKSIFTTANHRWNTIVKNGSSTKLVIKTTEELKDGDVLQRTHSGNRSKELKPCKTAIQHGIVFGDGTTESDGSTCITLCGDSVELIKHIDLGHIVNRGIKGAVVDNKKIVKK